MDSNESTCQILGSKRFAYTENGLNPEETPPSTSELVRGVNIHDLGEYSIQKIGDELFWVAPIEYHGFWKWKSADNVPGYVIVSAENASDPAELKTDYTMKYVPSAYFDSNLFRHARKSYPDLIFFGASFEPRDNGEPCYVISFGHYDQFRSVEVVDGALLVNPESGKIEKYRLEEMPSFVDQTIPTKVAEKYNDWFGAYPHGFWNHYFGKKDVHQPTQWGDEQEVAGVFGPDQTLYWFTDHEASSGTSSSMVGYSLMDARTGTFTYYTGANGFANGRAALESVNKTFTKDVWTGTTPVLYNIYGEDTWFIPVVDGNGLLREFALVNAKDPQILSHSKEKREAFDGYKYLLATSSNGGITPTNSADDVHVEGKVLRVGTIIGQNGTIFQVLLEGTNKVISINPALYPYASFITAGDVLQVTYIETKEETVSASQIYNKTINK